MLLPHWHIETTAGESREASGPEGWADCLSHEDVTEPGRIRLVRVTGHHGPVELRLGPSERLVFCRRRRRSLDPDSPAPMAGSDPSDRTIFGLMRPDRRCRSGFAPSLFAFVTSEGGVTLTTDFQAVI